MCFLFGHLLGAWIGGKGFQWLKRVKLSPNTWFFLLVGGILPDIDFILEWGFNLHVHRTLTHSLFFLIAAPLLLYLVLSWFKFKRKNILTLALGGGIAIHLLLDLWGGGIPLLWPDMLQFSRLSVKAFDPAIPSFLNRNGEYLKHSLKLAIFDMALGTVWIIYLGFRKKIKF